MTSQFDVFVNPSPASRRLHPFVVCLQSPLLSARTQQIVAPLVSRKSFALSSRITPAIRIDVEEYVVMIPLLASLPAKALEQRVANLQRHRDDLLAAVDLLFYGV
jgi:toxin CcdB